MTEVRWPFSDYSINFIEIRREKKANWIEVLIPITKFYLCQLILQEEINGSPLSIYV